MKNLRLSLRLLLVAVMALTVICWGGSTSSEAFVDDDLMKAAALADPELVKRLLEEGADATAVVGDGWTPLISAASGSYWDVVGTIPETYQRWGLIPPYRGDPKKRVEVAKLLLDKGANVNLANSDGETSLMWAARHGNTELVTMLLNRGAEVRAAAKNGETALMWAADTVRANVVQLLMDAGADVNATDQHGETALDRAARFGFAGVASLVGENRPRPDSTEWGQGSATSEAQAIWKRRSDVIGKLLAKGAEVNLSIAAMLGDLEKVRRFLAAGADVNARDSRGRSPLMWAAWKGHVGVARLLLQESADVNAKDMNGATPTIGAAGVNYHNSHAVFVMKANDGTSFMNGIEAKDVSMLKLLLANGGDVNAKDSCGWTALMGATAMGYTELVKLLLQNGADLNASLKNGSTALWLAADTGQTAIMQLLLEKSRGNKTYVPLLDSLLVSAAGLGRTHVVNLLLEAGADVNARHLIHLDPTAQTPVAAAARSGHAAVAKLLRSRGAEVTLTIAATMGDLAEVRRLLETGSNVNATDRSGYTPLINAAEKGNTEVVTLLVSEGADLNAKNNHGETALMVSERRGHQEIARFLRSHGATE